MVKCELCGGFFHERYLKSHQRLSHRSKAAQHATPTPNGVILLVEDNPDDEALTLRALQHNNLTNQVVIARDGRAALDYLFRSDRDCQRTTSDLPALVLLDLKLPKMDGVEVLRQIRAADSTKDIPVIVLTSSDKSDDRMKAEEFAVVAYIKKPVDVQEFLPAIRLLGLGWRVVSHRQS